LHRDSFLPSFHPTLNVPLFVLSGGILRVLIWAVRCRSFFGRVHTILIILFYITQNRTLKTHFF
jgi:hypothetical protein